MKRSFKERLRTVFDYQRFEPQPELNSVIAQTLSDEKNALEDADLDYISAAGTNDTASSVIPGSDIQSKATDILHLKN
ncbi:MAG: hypothetical protein K6E51_00390 [Treponema sp.]|nr:hypothetical protein [Treponema sp.]